VLGSVAVSEYAELKKHDPAVTERLTSLARPSVGQWWEIARLLVPVLADTDDSFQRVRDRLLGKTRDDLPYAAGLDGVLRLALAGQERELLEGRGSARATVRLGELFDRLVSYRNRFIGHAAVGQHPPDFYERMARALLAGMTELLGHIDVLAGRRMFYISEVRCLPSGKWQIDRYGLLGESAQRIEPFEMRTNVAASLPRPERIYLAIPDTGPEGEPLTLRGKPVTLRSLHPLLIFESESDEVLFLNARRGRQRTEYLSYTTGRVLARPDLGDEQRELLGRVLGMPIAAEQLEQWEARSQAEEVVAVSELQPSQHIGEFELISELGRGGMGVVYRAWQPSLGREVALKCLLRVGDAKAEKRFAREIRALGRVEHPHLVKIFTAGAEGDRWFYAMELVEGATLASLCDKLRSQTGAAHTIDLHLWQSALNTVCEESRQSERPISEVSLPTPPPAPLAPEKLEHPSFPEGSVVSRSYTRRVVELVKQVSEAVHALHEAGIIHRDIKPGNLIITPDGQQAILMDLGLAQLADEADGRLTRTRQFVGTLRYASPEQVLSAGHLDRRSDVYSLGATLWEMLTLRPIYNATEYTPTPDLMQRIQYEDPEPVRRHNPEVSRDLEAVIQKCLEKNPSRRYVSALELAQDLRRFLLGKPVLARPVGPAERLWRWCRRKAWAAILLALLVLTLIGGFAGITWQWLRALREHELAQRNLELAIESNISTEGLAKELRPMAKTHPENVARLLQLATDRYEHLLQKAGESNPLLEGKARMLSSFVEVYLALDQNGKARTCAEQAVELWQRLLQSEPDREAWQLGLQQSQELLNRIPPSTKEGTGEPE
jgi:serine/threonine protein kinase